MKTALSMSLLALIISVGDGVAAELKPDAINAASIASIKTEKRSSEDPDPAIVRLQVLLDRAGARSFSTGQADLLASLTGSPARTSTRRWPVSRP